MPLPIEAFYVLAGIIVILAMSAITMIQRIRQLERYGRDWDEMFRKCADMFGALRQGMEVQHTEIKRLRQKIDSYSQQAVWDIPYEYEDAVEVQQEQMLADMHRLQQQYNQNLKVLKLKDGSVMHIIEDEGH